jgi:hypothetical protein
MSFKVTAIRTSLEYGTIEETIYDVFSVSMELDEVCFIIYSENRGWVQVPAKYFKP